LYQLVYDGGGGLKCAFQLLEGQMVVWLGPSGCGKDFAGVEDWLVLVFNERAKLMDR